MEQLKSLMKLIQHVEQIVSREGVSADIDDGDEWMILHIQSGQVEGDQVIISDGLLGRGELIVGRSHVGEVRCCSMRALLCICECDTYVVGMWSGLGGEHAPQARAKRVIFLNGSDLD